MHGRNGQAQHGVDVYGRLGSSGHWQGVQCKGKDGRYGQAVMEAKLIGEVEKAKAFEPSLKSFLLATTAPNDAGIQQLARKLTEEHKGKGLFSVHVLGWDEIQRRLAKHPDVIDEYYPDLGPSKRKNLEKLGDLADKQNEMVKDLPAQTVSAIAQHLEPQAKLLPDSGSGRNSLRFVGDFQGGSYSPLRAPSMRRE